MWLVVLRQILMWSTCSTETDSCMTCSKKIRLFIICMQLQGFPIDSHTFVWVRRMIIVHNVVFLQILLLLWNKTYCTTWLYPMTVVAGRNTRSCASRAQWRCIHSRLFAKEVQYQCRHTTWGMLSTLMSLRHNKSRVEIHHYSIAYFYCITAFKALQHRNSIKSGAHTCRVDAWIPDKSTYHLWAPPLMKILCYSTSNAITQSRYATDIMFEFYPGLLQI